jgi:hypothetical protein
LVKLLAKDREIAASKLELAASKLEFAASKLVEITTQHYKLKGNLNIRALIEEYEQTHKFKSVRKALSVKVKVSSEEKKETFEVRPPSRKELWDKCTEEFEFEKLRECLEDSNTLRRDSIGERVSALYNSVSGDVHRLDDDDDAILIRRTKLFDHQVMLVSPSDKNIYFLRMFVFIYRIILI